MINVCFINGSPKAVNKSNSDIFIQKLTNYFNDDININKYYASKIIIDTSSLNDIIKNDKIVLVSPLYADTVPSGMLEFLSVFEKYLHDNMPDKNIEVYGIINCGFFEGVQCRHALNMFRFFCRKSHLKWRFGIGIGGGEYLKNIPETSSNSVSMYSALKSLGTDINNSDFSKNENIYLNPDKMTASIYRLSVNFSWCLKSFKYYKVSVPCLFKKIY